MSENIQEVPQELIETTAVTVQATESVVESYQAMNAIQKEEEKAMQAKEREALIIEASRLTGRVEALNFIKKVADTASLVTLKNIKENGIYKELPNTKTWEDYCKSIGISRRYLDEQLESLSTFGEDFLRTVQDFGLGYRELRSLSKQVKSGNLEIKSEEVVIDGEIIPLDEKDILKDALTELVAKNKEEISKLKTEIKAKEKVVQTYAEAKERKEQELQQAKIDNEALTNQIKHIYHGRLGKVAEEDRGDFQDITNLEHDANKLITSASLLLNKDYSNFNGNMFCAVISKLMVAIDDIRQKVGLKYEYNFDGGILTNEELKSLDNGETPLDFLDNE